ncbi:hypothetical protein [Dendrosporobacter sp. 1207_IL3150]|uniref:hypothetical protein n=1 Tax=Dendrosporobacter sp. 1207_IL3150 TaxID=3084054 RepID=UPI002FD9112B
MSLLISNIIDEARAVLSEKLGHDPTEQELKGTVGHALSPVLSHIKQGGKLYEIDSIIHYSYQRWLNRG